MNENMDFKFKIEIKFEKDQEETNIPKELSKVRKENSDKSLLMKILIPVIISVVSFIIAMIFVLIWYSTVPVSNDDSDPKTPDIDPPTFQQNFNFK
ncbi:gp20 [Listeria phage P40]|uniref:gp20 n=1 Tax=Listeria phage P40 TaxID=560178 RepID=UPI00018198DA|nr:gp20 [Listeria phage P40]ACI00380.1 gp20 [Listeria phage P40]